jgi:hypothetical protein
MNLPAPPPSPDLDARLARSWERILGDVLAPRRSRLERAMLAVGLPERVARLAAATPSLRGAWIAAATLVLVLASSAGDAPGQSAAELATLLALAPLVPVLAVAAAYGSTADRSQRVLAVSPLAGLRLALIRTTSVLAISVVITLSVSLLNPAAGWWRVAWLLPALATTTTSLALTPRLGTRRAAVAVAVMWVAAVLSATIAVDSLTPFGTVGQVASAVATACAAASLFAQRRSWAVLR